MCPYIKKNDRYNYEEVLKELPDIETKGDLEFCITYLMKRKFMNSRDYRYSTLHDCVYACQHSADEFRRRYLDKREDVALNENGDI